MDVVSLLIALLVLILVGGVLYWILQQLPLPEPWKKIALAILVLILLLVFLQRYALPFLKV